MLYSKNTNTEKKQIRGKHNPKKITISIPYKQRIDNINLVFQALNEQTMNKNDFEVIIGAMDYCENFIKLCKYYINKLNITVILSPAEFSIPWARNLAMRQATGKIIVQMDADTLLPPNTLQNLYDTHFSFDQKNCIVGQVVGYENNNEGHITQVDVQPYESYKKALFDLEAYKGEPRDIRFQVHHAIPWAFGWTGFIAIPLDIIRKNDLYFDETFIGWGVDDLEWSYRICKSGTPITLSESIRAMHLPHARNPDENSKTETLNYRRFIRKWPSTDVELSYAFGDTQANSIYLNFISERNKIFSYLKGSLGIIHGYVNSISTLIIGAQFDESGILLNTDIIKQFDNYTSLYTAPLIGMGLPFQDKEIQECRVLNTITNFSSKYLNKIYKEAHRASQTVLFL